MNSVLVATHNCLKFTQSCIASVLKQDIPTTAFVIDNGSTDGTLEWLNEGHHGILWDAAKTNQGVSKAWNEGLSRLFGGWVKEKADHVLVLNNDVVIPPWFFSALLSNDSPFVTGVSVGTMKEIAEPPQCGELVESPDFSAFLIRKDAWETIGRFDEKMVNYCGDLDYHLRAHFKGIHLMNSGVPFFHDRSSTLRNAPPRERRLIELRADADRDEFQKKWGFKSLSNDYAAAFNPKTFGIDKD